MLNKEICKICKTKEANKFAYAGDILDFEWNGGDEDAWDDGGRLSCPKNFWSSIDVYGEPPKACPYKLEHTIMSQKNAE